MPRRSAAAAAAARSRSSGDGGAAAKRADDAASTTQKSASAPSSASSSAAAAAAAAAAPPPLRKTAWMDPTLRAWLSATRPWSAPASLVPIALTGALLWRLEPELLSQQSAGALLLSPQFVLTLLGGFLVHLAANLTNTYFDFVRGVDTKEHADDRALVDQLVRPRDVLLMLGLCLAGALGVLLYFLFLSPLVSAARELLFIAGAGGALALFYSADPVGLKYRGLGDVCVFLCFGPLLMAGTSVCVVGTVPVCVLVYSVPLGLLTVAILHANNTRDVRADRAAGARTLAMSLTFEQNLSIYQGLLGGAYATVFLASLFVYSIGWRIGMVLVALPWSAYCVRKFRARQLAELPQLTAQMELFFGTALICALAEPMFLARFLLGCLFYLGGVNNVLMWSYVTPMLQEDVGNVAGRPIPLPLAQALLLGAIVAQTSAAIFFILGIYSRPAAALLIAFLLPVTLTVHDFWTIEDEEEEEQEQGGGVQTKKKRGGAAVAVAARNIATFPTEFDNEFVHFFKNIGMLGGLVVFLECGCV